MDFTKTLSELQKASLFELFRLNVAISKELRNPQRNFEILMRIKIGDHISYFDDQLNKLVDGTIVEINKTRVSIRNIADGHIWHMPFYMLNLDAAETDIEQTRNKKGLDINTVKVGDFVGFVNSRSGQELYGRVIRRNRKTASVMLEYSHQEWRVSYSCLFSVIDGEKGIGQNVIDAC